MVNKSISIVILLVFSTISVATANTDKLDNIAACSGIVLGNGAVDFFLEMKHHLMLQQILPILPIYLRYLPVDTNSLITNCRHNFGGNTDKVLLLQY